MLIPPAGALPRKGERTRLPRCAITAHESAANRRWPIGAEPVGEQVQVPPPGGLGPSWSFQIARSSRVAPRAFTLPMSADRGVLAEAPAPDVTAARRG